MTLDYFYGQSGELFSYFRIPKALFQDRRFRQLSTDARTLYGILLDRMSLSVKNGWLDEQGRVYIIYTVREVQESLCCAEHKAVKLFRELEGIDLIERKRRGLGRPSLIYVKDFSSGLPKAQVQNCPNSNSGAAESAILVQPKPQANKTDPKNARNKNVLVVGGSGSGKTRFWLKPNLLQCHSSYVVTDPKGTIVVECGNALLKNGYKVRILNTINFKKSMHYNPFAYVHSEKDILKLVTTLMTNTKGEGSGGDPFWEKSERLLLTALIAYLHYEAPVEEQNFATLLEMLNTMQVLEDDEEYQNPVDLLFEELAKKKPNSFAGRQYKLYKLAAGKTAKSILISCGARLAPFDIQELRDLTMYDELQLDTLGDKKTALFLIMSDTDSTFNFLISMVYTQLFNLLCDKADDVYGGKLPIHVRCLIDECANIGQIPNLEKLVATIRSREISACLVLQARSQLKAIYKDNADTIVGNMDSQIFLGGSEPTTLKDLSEMLGKETIDAFNTSDTRGNSPSYGTTFQKMGHELLSRDELAVLDGGKCILQLRGVRPFLSDKYDLTQHPNYKLTSDYDSKNTFDIEKYLNRKTKIHPGDEFIVVDADSLPSA